MRLLGVLCLTSWCGCVLLHDADGAGAGAGGSGAGAAGGGPTGGGAGGGPFCSDATGGDGPAPECPAADYAFSFGVDGTRATLGVISTIDGTAWIAGSYSAELAFGVTTLGFDNTNPLKDHYYVGRVGASGQLESANEIEAYRSDVFPATETGVGPLVATPDGGAAFVVRGHRPIVDGQSLHTENDATAQDALLVKVSSTGAIEWQRIFESTVQPISIDVLHSTPDGFVVGGSAGNAGASNITMTPEDWVSAGDIWIHETTAPSLFLIELSENADVVRYNITPAVGRLRDLISVGSRLFLSGTYEGAYPQFGNSMSLPPASAAGSAFVTELDASLKATENRRSFGFSNRNNKPVGLIDSCGGLAFFVQTNGSAGAAGEFQVNGAPPPTAPTVAQNQHVAAAVTTSSDLAVSRVEVNTLAGQVLSHAAGSRRDGTLVAGFQLVDADSAVDGYSQPEVDTIWLQRDPIEAGLIGVLPVGTVPSAGTGADLVLSSGPCGDLVVGTFDQNLMFPGDRFTGAGAERALITFRPDGLTFNPP